MIADRDPRIIDRPHLAEEQMRFFDKEGARGYVVATTEYSYGVVGMTRGASGVLDFWIPGTVSVVPERRLLRGNYIVPDLSDRSPNNYHWYEDIRMSDIEGRRKTFVGSDLLTYQGEQGGFSLSVRSAYPVGVYSVRRGEHFLWAVLNRRPKR